MEGGSNEVVRPCRKRVVVPVYASWLASVDGDVDGCFCRLAPVDFLKGFVITGDRFCKRCSMVPRGADHLLALMTITRQGWWRVGF
ncbi:hypothetical protein Hdeb2414_s0007g00246731 [Helianthus debilis subsp. tardiflorus]